jgi:hypothetical protein
MCGAECDLAVVDSGSGVPFRGGSLIVAGAASWAPRGIEQTSERALTIFAAPLAWLTGVQL